MAKLACFLNYQDFFFFLALQWIIGKQIQLPKPAPIKIEPLIAFDQTEFFSSDGDKDPSMDHIGYYYIPSKCRQTSKSRPECLLHFYFHGCSTGREFVGEGHIRASGYIELGEVNGIIMVFPQALSDPEKNPIGCWDTFGFTGKRYATKKGAQIKVIKAMLDRILEKHDEENDEESDYD